ncbi:MAG: hypothetical protein GOMPHAMPRED_007682 [Gomphillus americanus]|uniref:Uncharacterized protein n=1 Tax=Gomphillus americanus TaxID=1940652 RepID=A0A8H3ETN4_9LECA|nr:MAG: hypothetical protein GOMPHAMPRED_007682 [Gomphillus americanus]
MPATRSLAEAFSESESDSLTGDRLSPANIPELDTDDDGSFVPTTDGESGEEAEFFDIEELISFAETGEDDDDEDEEGEEEENDEGDATETEFHDAQDGENHEVTIEVSVDENDTVLQARPISGENEDESSGDDDMLYSLGRRRRRRHPSARPAPPPVPSPAGQELMDSGTFGLSRNWQDDLRKRKKRMARTLMNRELGITTEQVRRNNQEITQNMIPSSQADTIVHYKARCYSGQFSDDGNFFFSCAQDFLVRMYDTSNPYCWKYYKTVVYPFGQWTITDASLSPDNRFLAYSSIRTSVCLAATDPSNDSDPHELDFADVAGESNRARRRLQGSQRFGIWSIRFSGDGREIVAGTSDNSVYVYDIESNCSILRIPGHRDHVNAVCFGDVSSPHILYSGSDDTLIKVWDRRSMSDSREAGVFMGHTEGLTYVDSKGDGRYVLSNGKDQNMKLWDLRKMMSTEASAKIDPMDYPSGFDYRYMDYSADDYRSHEHDCSVVTYRGHSVLKTLIRCHFSPPNSTNSHYVYSGSSDGKIHVYNMDATVARIIDVSKATYESRPRDRYSDMPTWDGEANRHTWQTCVRDASWHPNAPVIAGEFLIA